MKRLVDLPKFKSERFARFILAGILNTGVAYAIWCGVGIILITLVSWIGFGQRMDGAALAGMTLIVAGVAVINLFSTTATAG